MHADKASTRDKRSALKADLVVPREAAILPGGIGAAHASRKYANIAQAMDSENGPAAVFELRTRR
jgi:hypothetical protein